MYTKHWAAIKLKKLNPRDKEIFFMLCSGSTYKDISKIVYNFNTKKNGISSVRVRQVCIKVERVFRIIPDDALPFLELQDSIAVSLYKNIMRHAD